MAELQTPGGLQGVHLLPADVVFDWLFDDNRDLAKAMGACGANVYLLDTPQSKDVGILEESRI